jgi:hypothetical protein
MAMMAHLRYGRLSEAWKGEAADFTPLLAEQLDEVGAAIGLDLASLGKSEVATAGGRRIDIVAQDANGVEFVIENQYGRADHDHLTRGLAYAVARQARGLILIAEEHRDEFRALAQYLNDMAELDPDRGICVWLVEAKAVRIGDSPWAPLFTAVIEPNAFTASVEQAKQTTLLGSLEEFWKLFSSPSILEAAQAVVSSWVAAGHRTRLGPNHVVLEAAGPGKGGYHTVVTIYPDGKVFVPFSSYAGQNSGIPIEPLTTDAFRARANSLFGFNGTEKQARTQPGWLTESTRQPALDFCFQVANAYLAAATERTVGGQSHDA